MKRHLTDAAMMIWGSLVLSWLVYATVRIWLAPMAPESWQPNWQTMLEAFPF